MNPRWFLHMSKWVRHPPSTKRVKLVFGVVAVCAVLFVIERYIGWPDWLSLDPNATRPRFTRP